MQAGEQRLLGRLAELGWFGAHGEVAATRSLAMLLEDDQLRYTILAALHERTAVDVSPVVRFLAEQVHMDGARPDVEGLDIKDRPLVVIEAKFDAVLSVPQIRAYLADQSARLAAEDKVDSSGIFVLLIPEKRLAEAKHKIQQAFQAQAQSSESAYRATPLVVTWNEWLDLWQAAVSSTPSPDGLAADIVQLRAMCLALGGVVIAPLGTAAAGAEWRSREDEYRVVTDHVTRALSDPNAFDASRRRNSLLRSPLFREWIHPCRRPPGRCGSGHPNGVRRRWSGPDLASLPQAHPRIRCHPRPDPRLLSGRSAPRRGSPVAASKR